ncbi:MAG: hypothetical protein Q8L40_02745, partial [Burkholderiales bacterium]|nr:hypothetical protein [Burkholderiales bacterium]
YGIIGIKVWVFKGMVLAKNEQPAVVPGAMAPAAEPEKPARKPRKPAAKTGAKRATASQT